MKFRRGELINCTSFLFEKKGTNIRFLVGKSKKTSYDRDRYFGKAV